MPADTPHLHAVAPEAIRTGGDPWLTAMPSHEADTLVWTGNSTHLGRVRIMPAVLPDPCAAKAQLLQACAAAQDRLRQEIGLLQSECARYEALAQRVRAMPGDVLELLDTLL